MLSLSRRTVAGRWRGGLAWPLPFFVAVLALSGLSSALLAPARPVAAAPVANQDLTIFAGPGAEYEVISFAPAGSAISVDGDAVGGFYPVSYNGVSGWAADWAIGFDAAPVAAEPAGEWTNPAATGAEGEWVDPALAAPVADEPVYDEPVYEEPLAEPAGSLPAEPTAEPTEVEPAPLEAAPDTSYGAATGGEDEITAMIYEAADRYGQSRQAMLRVARCESGLNPNAVDPAGLYHGLFQFVPETFAGTPYGGYSIYDPWANAHAAAWMWSEGRKGEWVCQ